jgi:ubiquinone/menaquinone biosynthesis C-methylase UbiE
MNAKYSASEIFDYWTQQALTHAQSTSASWSDHHVIELEIREMTKWLRDSDVVLEVGCANGYSSMRLASVRSIRMRSVDYIPEMIKQARLRSASTEIHLKGSVEFAVGDITQLQEQSSSYDKVIVVRVLINLGDWKRQIQGLRECIRVLKPGGVLLLSEATLQGWKRLNLLRREWGLEAIPIPPFNQYLDEDQLVDVARDEMDLVEISNFASSYYVGTRLIKPLLARATNAPIEVANPLSEWNRWCSQLAVAGDYGTQKLFVFRKR